MHLDTSRSALEALHNAPYKFKTYLLTYLLTHGVLHRVSVRRFRCGIYQPVLATRTESHTVQDRLAADIQSCTRQRAVITGISHSHCQRTWPVSSSLHWHKPCSRAALQTSGYYYYYYRVLRAICCQPVDGSLICFM